MANNIEDVFSSINSQNVTDHVTSQPNVGEPTIGEILFPQVMQTDSEIEWYRGEATAPTPLSLSSFDAKAGIRDRQNAQKVTEHTQYSKQSYLIDERMRQKLLSVQASGTQAQKDMILNLIFNDTDNLLKAAKTTAEIMRMSMLKTGKINLSNNGVQMNVDYGMKPTHIVTSDTLWTDDKSQPYEDIQVAMDTINSDSGQTPTRILMNSVTYRALQSNSSVKQTILNPTVNVGAVSLSNQLLDSYLSGLGLTVQVYDKQYRGFDGVMHKYIDDGQVIIMPDGDLGKTVFSTTPEQADLMSGADVDVSVTDGIAVSTYMKKDPVNKIIKASQQLMPTFEMIDGVYVLNGVANAKANRTVAQNNSSSTKSSK